MVTLIVIGAAFYLIIGKESSQYLLDRAVQDHDYTETLYSSTTELTGLDLEMVNRNVNVIRADVEKVEITYYQSDKDAIEIKESSGILVLDNKVKKYAFNMFSKVSNEKRVIQVVLPQNLNYNISIETINGNHILEDLGILKNVELKTINGTITVKKTETINNFFINSTNGFIYGENLKSSSMCFETTNGEIQLSSSVCNDISLSSINGSISVEVLGIFEEYKIDVSTVIGKIYYDDLVIAKGIINKEALKKLKIKIITGDIRMIFS